MIWPVVFAAVTTFLGLGALICGDERSGGSVMSENDDEDLNELLRLSLRADPKVGPITWTETSQLTAETLWAAMEKVRDAPIPYPVLLVHPKSYQRARDILGIHDRPLTQAEFWKAAETDPTILYGAGYQ